MNKQSNTWGGGGRQAARSDQAWLDFLVLLSRFCGSKRTEDYELKKKESIHK